LLLFLLGCAVLAIAGAGVWVLRLAMREQGRW
jgi:hypothetical protein